MLDGEILVWNAADDRPAPFALLQQRIGRKNLTRKMLDEAPVSFMAYDLLEQDGQDVRALPQRERRVRLEALLQGSPIRVSPIEQARLVAGRSRGGASARASCGVEGFMLKRMDAAYGTGRTKAEGAVVEVEDRADDDRLRAGLRAARVGPALLGAHRLHLRGVEPPAGEARKRPTRWCRRSPARSRRVPGALQLVAFAKAYSGLTDEEFRQVDAIIRKTTVEKFGPVRSVRPSLVFELGFEGINRSSRHKSGIAVRFPRMLRIRFDKPLHEANSLQDLEALLKL